MPTGLDIETDLSEFAEFLGWGTTLLGLPLTCYSGDQFMTVTVKYRYNIGQTFAPSGGNMTGCSYNQRSIMCTCDTCTFNTVN